MKDSRYPCVLDIIQCNDPIIVNTLIDQVSLKFCIFCNYSIKSEVSGLFSMFLILQSNQEWMKGFLWPLGPCAGTNWREIIFFICYSLQEIFWKVQISWNIFLYFMFFILQRGIENVLLIEDSTEARNVMMRNPPRCAREVCFFVGFFFFFSFWNYFVLREKFSEDSYFQ